MKKASSSLLNIKLRFYEKRRRAFALGGAFSFGAGRLQHADFEIHQTQLFLSLEKRLTPGRVARVAQLYQSSSLQLEK